MMGGQECYRIAKNQSEIKQYSCYKKIYVETETMMKCLVDAGMRNVAVFPNCRKRPDHDIHEKRCVNQIRCVFFSIIQPEKGVDIILDVAKELTNVEFFFYGPIKKEYEAEFVSKVKTLNNVSYKGVFTGSNLEVYRELAKYDVLLFPTKWKTEGVPGILVEGKIAGLAEIVSNKSYNAELVKDGIEGIVLAQNDKEQLANAIMLLDRERGYLERIKLGSRKSADRFYADNYIENIRLELE